ncbi:MAG: SIS domain-containing protein [Lachnospiraceae bacterium]|nr:SIS domain-containing protein [Lachnospiraceae bacterium]
MEVKYIIVQAGGKGSRLEHLTKNKPKALVPVNNLPMIFHLFRKYPEKKYIIIGDYKSDVLEKYLNCFAEVDYQLISGKGHTGTCAGLNEALSVIPRNEAFMLIWCDLILADSYQMPEEQGNYIGISKDFVCRWKYERGQFIEEKSETQGVAGQFIFQDKVLLESVPDDGEFVRWLQSKRIELMEQPLYQTHEYGLLTEWDKLPKLRCRPFNSIEIKDGRICKKPLDDQGEMLAALESSWYKLAISAGIKNIPYIYSYQPLCMEYIHGKNIYEYNDVSFDDKKIILDQIVHCLKHFHELKGIAVDKDSYYEAYIGKTAKRLEKVKELVPFAQQETIRINGKEYRNVFFHWKELEKEVMKYIPDSFKLLHGDCTFSNIMLKNDEEPILIDPRGYFGHTEYCGDPAYDWVKLYYSIASNYDQFNLKRFRLSINEKDVTLTIDSNHWEEMEDYFFELLGKEVTRKQMKLLLAITWLSLTTYAWEDYDSICGAYYNGLIYFEEALLMSEDGLGDEYFSNTIHILDDALKNLDKTQFEKLTRDVETVLKNDKKVIVSGLGKNVPVCDKFTGTMLSLGLNANFLHTNSAVHGDMGMVKPGDLVIVLSKSGNTSESCYLAEHLKRRKGTILWALTFAKNSKLSEMIGEANCLVVDMEHEGDMWNIVPNNSTTLNLIILQALAMTLARRMELSLEADFKPNHPGGAIGERLKHE